MRVGTAIYDVDYYVEKAREGRYEVVKAVLHKPNGRPVGQVSWERTR